MQKYKYTAVNMQNKQIKGTFIAENEKDLAEQLANQGLYLISATVYTSTSPSAFAMFGFGRVKLAELTTFSRQFAIMLSTHIPLLDALEILKGQTYSDTFKRILEVVYDDVKSGMLLSAAFEKHKAGFPDFFRSMISIGESSGKLDLVFNSLAEYYEKESATRRKMRSAMAYPLMLLAMTVGIVILMLTMVVPTFREALSDLDVAPDGITQTVYDISDFVLAYWVYILILTAVAIIAVAAILMTEGGKYFRDLMLINMQLTRKIQINTATARFARALALLLSSGMDLNEALNSVEIILTNRYMKKKFHGAAEQVRHGVSLTNAFESIKLFPPMMIKMLAVGEKTNSLDDVLLRSCSFFDDQVESAVAGFTARIQPTMLLIMGSVVAVLFIAVYSPMLSIMGGL